MHVGTGAAQGGKYFVLAGASDDRGEHFARVGEANCYVVGGIAAFEMPGAINGIENDEIRGLIAGKALFERSALFGDDADGGKVLQDDAEENILQTAVDCGKGRRSILCFVSREPFVGLFADISYLAIKNERGLCALTHNGQERVYEVLRINVLVHKSVIKKKRLVPRKETRRLFAKSKWKFSPQLPEARWPVGRRRLCRGSWATSPSACRLRRRWRWQWPP